MSAVASLPEEQLRSILEPEFNSTSFTFGKNPDGTPRTWQYRPLPWKWEKQFRRSVMPMLAVTYKPFESLLGAFASSSYIEGVTPSTVEAMFKAEVDTDEFLTQAVLVILLSQAPGESISLSWVEDNAESRDQLFRIVEKQCELHQIMDRLGELLAERLVKLAQMMGVEVDLATLKQLWKQVSANLSARIMKVASIADSASGPFTETSYETMSPTTSPVVVPDLLRE